MEKANPDIVVTVCANKVDLEEERAITSEEGKKFAEEGGYLFKEVSAKTNQGVQELFEDIAKKLPKTQTKTKRGAQLNEGVNKTAGEDDSYCSSC